MTVVCFLAGSVGFLIGGAVMLVCWEKNHRCYPRFPAVPAYPPLLTPEFMAMWRATDATIQRAAEAEADSHEREWLR